MLAGHDARFVDVGAEHAAADAYAADGSGPLLDCAVADAHDARWFEATSSGATCGGLGSDAHWLWIWGLCWTAHDARWPGSLECPAALICGLWWKPQQLMHVGV